MGQRQLTGESNSRPFAVGLKDAPPPVHDSNPFATEPLRAIRVNSPPADLRLAPHCRLLDAPGRFPGYVAAWDYVPCLCGRPHPE